MENIFFNDEIITAESKIISSLKIPSLILMENAGANSADYIYGILKKNNEKNVLIICGKGNNAGDGFVIARHLGRRNLNVKVILLYRSGEMKGDALTNYNILKNLKRSNTEIIFCGEVKSLKKEISNEYKYIIDAIFGTGFKGGADAGIRNIISYINEQKGKTIISVDIPSCLYNYNQKEECIKADITLCMGVKKFNSLFYKGKKYSGRLELINIGIPEESFTHYNYENKFQTESSDFKNFIPVREKDSNKYSNGKVFVLAGSPGLTGAAFLSSLAALRSGAGAVIAGIPESLNEIMEIKLTEVMTLPLAETDEQTLSERAYNKIREKLIWADAVLLGPGLSKNEETGRLIRKIVSENNNNFIIDADAIYFFRNNLKLLKRKNIIITPHTGEFSGLINTDSAELKNNFFTQAVDFALKYKSVVLLKNSPSIITDGKRFYINPNGRENLATAGTGDVLSGITAGLFAKTKDAFMSAAAAAYIHGKCGDILYEKRGSDSTIAGDLLDLIPEVKNAIRNSDD